MKKQRTRAIAAALSIAMLLPTLSACGHVHKFGEWKTKKKATCEKEGLMVRTCDCGEERTKEIDKTEHEYESEITKAPGCQGNGENTFTCKVCEDSYTEEIAPTEYTATEIYDMYKGSVGEIVVYDTKGQELSLGSCFVYEEGKLITNYHVIEDSCAAKVTFGEDTYDVQKVLAYDKDIDIAILTIDNEDLEPLPLCDKEHAVGSPVYALGNSRGLTSTFSDGMITTAIREVEGVNYVQHDAPISGGNSGGPLFNVYGEVIGINTWTVLDSQNLNFAIALTEMENVEIGSGITMEEFYNTECNAYEKLKAYIMAEGEYDDGKYSLPFDRYTSSSDASYIMLVTYDPTDEEIAFWLNMNSVYSIHLFIDKETSGKYTWAFFYDDNMMYGDLTASTFTTDSTLYYSYSDFYYGESTYASLASSLMALLLIRADNYITGSGVTVNDLGFTAF